VTKEQPLWHRIYYDDCYTEVVRAIGYEGCTYREMLARLEPLEKQFGKQRVHAATVHLFFYEGQFTCNPKPLAHVRLREEIRTLVWQLLGPPPEHPEYAHYHQPEPFVPSWAREPQKPAEPAKPKKSRKAKAT
jgi:hypothetical protein